MGIAAKICGLTTAEAVKTARDAGADMVGFVFYPPSPRAIDVDLARALKELAGPDVQAVGVFVDPDDDLLDRTISGVGLDMVQLHGSESPERVAEIRRRFKLPVIKAIQVTDAEDVTMAREFEPVADYLMFDAKPPAESLLPGGNGAAFDWSLLDGQSWQRPWILSGGLNADVLEDAVATSGAAAVDVSSGVETVPGAKAPELIEAFLEAANRISQP
ncbi:MAG: phosphoribosylanthranilate isomerase [Sphingomonadales bacterium]|nr:phosphoribosylanthranilate isomerase [Sphingomonadales bacterium]